MKKSKRKAPQRFHYERAQSLSKPAMSDASLPPLSTLVSSSARGERRGNGGADGGTRRGGCEESIRRARSAIRLFSSSPFSFFSLSFQNSSEHNTNQPLPHLASCSVGCPRGGDSANTGLKSRGEDEEGEESGSRSGIDDDDESDDEEEARRATTPPRRPRGAGLFVPLRGNEARDGTALGRIRARDIAFPLVSRAKVFFWRRGAFEWFLFFVSLRSSDLASSLEEKEPKKPKDRCFSRRPRRAWRSQQLRSPPLPSPPPRRRLRARPDAGSPAADRREEPPQRPRRREGVSAPASSPSAPLLPASLAGPPPRPRARTSRT